MKLFKDRLLTSVQLKRLGEHKYSCCSVSLLDPYLQPYWTWLVSKVPLWLAPNLITILGLMVNIFTTLILVWYSPDAKQEAPRWACALCAFGLFIYQSLDAIDGKQARRTGTSSPLGELFDHGCDSISTIFVALSACIAVQLGHYPTWMFFQCFCAMTLFYCAHWQTYVSGTLRFGKIDVTEAQFTIMGIHMISAVFGSDIWRTEVISLGEGALQLYVWYVIPVGTFACGTWSLYYVFSTIFTGGVGKNGSTVAVLGLSGTQLVTIGALVGGFNVLSTYVRAFNQGGCGKNGSTIALRSGSGVVLMQLPIVMALLMAVLLAHANITVIFNGGCGKNGSTVAGTSVLSPIIPFSLVLVPAFIICRKSVENVYENHPSLYILAFGMVAAKVTNRLVVAHMTKSEMDYMDWSLLGPAMLFLNQYFNTFVSEHIVLWLCMIWATFDLVRYSAQICLEICDYLHIQLFRIPSVNAAMTTTSSHHHHHQASITSTQFTDRNGTNVLKGPKTRSRKHYS